MSTRTALGLAILLLVLTIVQWLLRDASESVEPRSLDPVPEVAPAVDLESDLAPEIEEPVLEIPEYVPPRITERPREPLEFPSPELEIELGMPRVGGAVETLSEP